MAVNNQSKNNLAYGLNNALQNLSPLPIIAKRAPSSRDIGEFGQPWVYNDQVWMFTSQATWTELAAAGNSGTFTELTVNGPTELNGELAVVTANNSITLNSGTAVTNIGTDAAAKAITIGNVTGATSVDVNSGTGGIVLDANSTGNITVNAATQTVSPVGYAFTQNAIVGSTSIVVPADIVANAVISIVMTNNQISALDTPVLCTVATNDTGGGLLQIQGVVVSSNTLTISAKNVGSATIASATKNVIVSYMILGAL